MNRIFLKRLMSVVVFSFIVLYVNHTTNTTFAEGQNVLYIDKAEMVIFTSEENLKVVEVVTYVNDGSNNVLEIRIPENAKGFSVFAGLAENKFKKSGNKLIYNGELPKKPFSVTYGYVLDLDESQRSTLLYEQPYVVKQNFISIPVGKLTVQAEKFYTQSKLIELDDVMLRQFRRVDLPKDTKWKIQFQTSIVKQISEENSHIEEKNKDGLPIIGHAHGGNPQEATFNIIFVIFILILGIVSISYTNTKKQFKLNGKGKQLIEKDMILDELQRLQERRKRKELTEEEYKHVFQLKYKRLKELAITLEGEKL